MPRRFALRKEFIGLCLALALLLLTVAAGEAGAPRQDGDAASDDCQSCHGEIHGEWEDGMHGQAASDREFQQEWKKEGSPIECMACHTTGFDPATGDWAVEGIDCTVCHDSAGVDHPEEILPTADSAESCGTCHEETFAEWEKSVHGDETLDCVNCHNPHTTDLRAENSQALCQTCHNEESHFYDFTAHAAEGLLCTDCHLRVSDAAMGLGEGHSQRVHTFQVDLRSCTQCHGEEMHYPVREAMHLPGEDEVVQSGVSDVTNPVARVEALARTPEDANPFTYLLAVVVGLGVGITLSPVLDGVYRRLKSRSQ
ncbi:MAG: cytochrome c3 family protein [Candidatus Promineifilaceae bacterium]|nr:cytochrome c3 family protein [Candidatus Promineifilaceae bacterium]